MRVWVPVVVAAVVTFAACAGTDTASTARVTTLSQARQDYLAGLKALEEADYATATELLQKVARGPSYIVYSPLARLRLADALFLQDKFEEAAEAYRAFTETNSGDPNLHYAWFMMAKSRVKALPAEFFLVPPADRRDQRKVRSALGALLDFVATFPDSPHAEEGIALLSRMVGVVTSYEMDVAHFYMTRDKPVGAANRLRRLIAEVPRAGAREDTRAALVEALAAAGDEEGLRRECEAYAERFPAGRHRRAVLGWCAPVRPAAVD